MKTAFYVEHQGLQANEKDLVAKIKDLWVADGHIVKEIKTLNLYAKPEDGFCYYTINGKTEGKIALF